MTEFALDNFVGREGFHLTFAIILPSLYTGTIHMRRLRQTIVGVLHVDAVCKGFESPMGLFYEELRKGAHVERCAHASNSHVALSSVTGTTVCDTTPSTVSIGDNYFKSHRVGETIAPFASSSTTDGLTSVCIACLMFDTHLLSKVAQVRGS